MNILFVDDEQRRMSVLVEELEYRGHVVAIASGVDSALAVIEDAAVTIDLLIMDVAMPAGTTLEFHETGGGERVGIALYKRLRAVRPSVPVIVFTNVSDRLVEKYFGTGSEKLCRFVRKPDVLPSEFGDLVVAFTNEAL